MKFLIRTTTGDIFDIITREQFPGLYSAQIKPGAGIKAWFFEVKTLEELQYFIKACRHPVIISEKIDYYILEIYNYWRE